MYYSCVSDGVPEEAGLAAASRAAANPSAEKLHQSILQNAIQLKDFGRDFLSVVVQTDNDTRVALDGTLIYEW